MRVGLWALAGAVCGAVLGLALVTLATVYQLSATLPSFNAVDTIWCAGQGDSLRDLDSVFVYVQRRWEATPRLVQAARVRGMEGMPWVSDPFSEDMQAVAWFVTSDTAGNRSCGSNPRDLNLVTGVPDTVPKFTTPRLAERWYDVTGRRVQRPTRSGVYFVQAPGRPIRRVAVIH